MFSVTFVLLHYSKTNIYIFLSIYLFIPLSFLFHPSIIYLTCYIFIATNAFKAAGAQDAFAAVMEKVNDESNKKFKDSNSNDFAKAVEMFA